MRCFLYMPRKSSKSNLPAKPFPQATFAGIPSAAAVRPVSNYRQNLSHTPLLPVSRAPPPSARCRTTGKTFPTRHFCRYPERRRRPPGVELPAKPFPHATFAGIQSAVAVRPVSNLPAKPFPRHFRRYPAHRENTLPLIAVIKNRYG